ncbi:glycosyltransferase family 4 protein [Calothrix sp. 336/3]|uniref:glycosyltransferase family 4 protein n=1 Tax=Calothrix sp. 336/3 TaxID=1337936 RepID=UPI0004E3DD4F|nr:glycosyltransferase family 1 protein [Calothrix sp. 336/3]AKG24644.1 mannosyltransferase [Calothrix sp. 336/3]
MHQLLINLSVIFNKPTGISNYSRNLFPYLQFLNPTLLTSETYPGFNCYEIPGNMTPAQGTKGHLKRLLWSEFKLPKIYNNLQSSLIFSPIPEASLSNKFRHVVMVHDLIPLRFPKRFSPLTPYFHYYIPSVLRRAEHIICNSQATARDIVDFYQISPDKITPILLGYDKDNFRHFADKGRKEKPYFLYLGRHNPYKNLHRLVSAFAALSNCQNYELWFAGPKDNKYTPLLTKHIQELGLTSQVKFLDYVPYQELPQIIAGAIAMVFPSLWEGFGFPVLEAMACGTPVITSNLSSLPEVAGDAAILINPYNISEITEAMYTIATNNQERDRLITAGSHQVKKFSWQKTGQATAEILQKYL